MSLREALVDIPLAGGAQEGKNPIAFDPPAVAASVNTRVPKEGMVGKRHGEDFLAASILPPQNVVGFHNAIADQDGRAVVQTAVGMYTHDDVLDEWTAPAAGQPIAAQVKTDPCVRQNNSSINPDIVLCAIGSRTVACVAWTDSDTLESLYMFLDVPADGSKTSVLSGPTQFGGSQIMQRVRLAAIGSAVYAIGWDPVANVLYACSADIGTSYTFSAPAAPATYSVSARPLALLSDATRLWVVIHEGSSSYSVRRVDTSFVLQASQVVAGSAALDAIHDTVNSRVVVLLADGSFDYMPDSIAVAPTNKPVFTVGAGNELEGVPTRGTLSMFGTGYALWWERDNGSSSVLDYGVAVATTNSIPTVTASGVIGTVKLGSRGAYDAAVGVLPLVGFTDIGFGPSSDALWRTGWLASTSTKSDGSLIASPVAQWGVDLAAGDEDDMLPSLVADARSGQFLHPYTVITDATRLYRSGPKRGLDLCRTVTKDASAVRVQQASGITTFGGGVGASYADGVLHSDMTPSPQTVFQITGETHPTIFYNNSASPVGPLWLKVAVRWRDAKGNLHRGTPIYAVNTAYKQTSPSKLISPILIRRPFPNAVNGEKGGQHYELEVYAANDEAGPYYFFGTVTPEAHPDHFGIDYFLANVVTTGNSIDSATVPDGTDYIVNIGDIYVTSFPGTPIWTDSGELTHIPPPPAVDLCSTQTRLWLLSGERGRLDLWPSKLLTPGYAPEFPAALAIPLPDDGGEATAIAALGDRIVVFKQERAYAIYGDPGDNTGAGSTLGPARLIPGDVGCKEPNSVVTGAFGAVFRGQGGFHLLAPGSESFTRLPQLEDTLDGYRCTSGVLVASEREVRWSLVNDDGERITVVWDYENNAWQSYDYDEETVHAAIVGGSYARISTELQVAPVAVERAAWMNEDAFSMSMTSAWLKPNTKLGFARIWKTLYQLAYQSGSVRISIGYDYEATFFDVRTWTAAEMSNVQLGKPSCTLEVQHTRQKCKAFRFKIEEISNPNADGAGFELLAVSALLGQKRGTAGKLLPTDARK